MILLPLCCAVRFDTALIKRIWYHWYGMVWSCFRKFCEAHHYLLCAN